MAQFTAIENTPIDVDLLTQANTTGWIVSGGIATHSACVPGSIILTDYPVTAGVTYRVTFAVLTLSGGYVRVTIGGANGSPEAAPGFYTQTVTAVADGFVSFYSNSTCSIQAFNIQNTAVSNSNTQQNTPVFSVNNRKFGEFRTIAPDFGFSLGVDMFTIYQGSLYIHENGSDARNTFYGIPYQSIVTYVNNVAPEIVKTYQSLSIQSNQLMVTGTNGISTSLGQISELAEIDFIKDILADNNGSVAVETIEGVFSANFLRDANTNLIDGDVLRGNYMTITLLSTAQTPIRIYTVNIVAQKSAIGSR